MMLYDELQGHRQHRRLVLHVDAVKEGFQVWVAIKQRPIEPTSEVLAASVEHFVQAGFEIQHRSGVAAVCHFGMVVETEEVVVFGSSLEEENGCGLGEC